MASALEAVTEGQFSRWVDVIDAHLDSKRLRLKMTFNKLAFEGEAPVLSDSQERSVTVIQEILNMINASLTGRRGSYLQRFPESDRQHVEALYQIVEHRLVTERRRGDYRYSTHIIGRTLVSAHVQLASRASKNPGLPPIDSVTVRLETVDNVAPEASSQTTLFEASPDQLRELAELLSNAAGQVESGRAGV